MSESADRKSLLIVDDEKAILLSFQLAFEDGGWNVTTAESGEVAMNVFKAGAFDLVITDKNLPLMSGVDVVAQIREQDQDVTVVMLTGYGSKDSAIDTLNLGVDAYVEKPVSDVYRLLARTDALLKRRRRRRAKQKTAPAPVADDTAFRVMVLSGEEARAKIIVSHFEADVDEVKVVPNLDAAQSVLSRTPYNIVVVEESAPSFANAVATIKREHEEISVAVVGQALGIEIIMQLIDVGVSSFIKEPLGSVPCSKRVGEFLTHVRSR